MSNVMALPGCKPDVHYDSSVGVFPTEHFKAEKFLLEYVGE